MDIGRVSMTGLVSELDVDGIITQLGQIRRRPVQLLEQHQADCTSKLTALAQLSARMLSLSTACSSLGDGSSFHQVMVGSSDEATVIATASAGAPAGRYHIAVTQLAQSHKISSTSLVGADEALGLEGEVLLGGQVISISAADTLEDIRDAINQAGAGATASILHVSETDCRLFVTSLASGADGALDLIDANDSDLLEALGLQTSVTTVKHAIPDGAASDAFADKLMAVGQVLGLSRPPAGTVQINGVDVAIDLATDGLQDIAAAIDALDGVSATVLTEVADGQTTYRIEIVGDTGRPTLSDDGNVLVTLGVLTKTVANEVDAAQDALFSIGGVAMTRSSNAVDDAIENVQLQLLQENAATVTITRDPSATVAAVESFVSAYNQVVALINDNQDFDTETETGGAFFGSPTILNLESDLRRQISMLVDTMGGDLVLASQVGLNTGADDQLVLDSSDLLAALEADPEGVERLFGTITAASDPAVTVQSHTAATRDSGADGYAVEVTRVATQATATSAPLPGGIALDETLTINDRQVTLTAGMSLQDAADLLNSLFTAQGLSMSASVEGDRLQIAADVWGAVGHIDIVSSLDDGAGGTDLGGALAGEVATVQGQDVAGTIHGESCTGRGRLLIADDTSANTAGLKLLITAQTPGSLGVVRVSKGIAARMADFVTAATDARSGTLTRAADGIEAEIEAIDEQIADVEAEVDRYVKQLQVDFALMEAKISQSTTLLDWMTLQIDSLPGWRQSTR